MPNKKVLIHLSIRNSQTLFQELIHNLPLSKHSFLVGSNLFETSNFEISRQSVKETSYFLDMRLDAV